MAWRLWVSAARETSAQTGRPFGVSTLLLADCFRGMRLFRNFYFTAFRETRPLGGARAAEKDNRGGARRRPPESVSLLLKSKSLAIVLGLGCVRSDATGPNQHTCDACREAPQNRAPELSTANR